MGLFVLMKKYYIGIPLVLIWSVIFLISILGFIWETVDVGKFVSFALITSILIPLAIEVFLIVIFCQYITIDDIGIKKYFLKKELKEFKWDDIKEIRVTIGFIYISTEELVGEQKDWNKKKYVYIMCSDKLIAKLKQFQLDEIKINF